WVPVRPPIAAVSIATLLPVPLFQVSSHSCWFPFCHRIAVWPPIACCLHRHTVAPNTGFWPPVTGQMSVKCAGDSMIDGHSSALSY
ncbi:unnamed protein product, partial [Staurois parvus]